MLDDHCVFVGCEYLKTWWIESVPFLRLEKSLVKYLEWLTQALICIKEQTPFTGIFFLSAFSVIFFEEVFRYFPRCREVKFICSPPITEHGLRRENFLQQHTCCMPRCFALLIGLWTPKHQFSFFRVSLICTFQ